MLNAVIVGPSKAEAARARFADECFTNYWVVRADQVGGAAKRFALAMLLPDKAPTYNMSSECSKKNAHRMVRFQPTAEKK